MPERAASDQPQRDLQQWGYRLTPQRERILKVFQELPEGTHLSAEELYQRLSSQEPRISLATAYRTLKLLASLGFLREVDFAEGHKHYEYHREGTPHQHITCVVCGKTREFASTALEQDALEVARPLGFELLDVTVHVSGVCADCRSKGAAGAPR